MANEELSQFTELAEGPAIADLFGVVDVSDTTDASTGTTKRNKAQYALGSQVNAQTGTTYTYLTTDFRKLVTHSNGSAIAGTLPQAGASFPAGWFMFVQNRGAGVLTITPTTSTIDGAATLVLSQNEGAIVISDGTNYFTLRGKATGAAGVGDVVGPASATDEALARFDTTTGKLLQDSPVTVNNDGAVTVPEIAAPSTPASGKVAVYAKTDGKLYIKDDAGTETDLTAAGSGSPNPTSTVIPYNNAGTFADSPLSRTDANTIEHSNGTGATSVRQNLYGLKNGANFERLGLGYDTGQGWYVVASEKGGTGTARSIAFVMDGTSYWRLSPTGLLSTFNSAARLSVESGTAASPSIQFGGGSGTSWGIYHPDAGVIGFSTSSSQRFRVYDGGVLLGSGDGYRFASTALGSGTTPDVGVNRQAAGVLEVNNGTSGQRGVVLLRAHTFAQLPGSPVAGMLATVSDSNTATWGATIAGGGALTTF